MIATNAVAPFAHSLRVLAQQFKDALLSYQEFQNGDPEIIQGGVQKLDKADAVLEELQKEEAAIATDLDLSTSGKQKALSAEADKFHKQLRFVGEAAKDRRTNADQLKQKLTAIPKAQSNETTDYLIGAEIRERLTPLPMSERMKMVLNAMANGQTAVLRAILTDLFGQSLIEPEFLRRVQEESAQKTEGQQWREMESLMFVAERLEQLATAIDLQLTNYNALPSFPGRPTRTTVLAFQDTMAAPAKASAVDVPPPGGVQGLQ